MLTSLLYALKQRFATGESEFPELPEGARSLPVPTSEPCLGVECSRCVSLCPTGAIRIGDGVTLDRGLCVTCGACVEACPTGAIQYDRGVQTAALQRADLILRSGEPRPSRETLRAGPFSRSIDIREVSTGCNATDLEVAAISNPVFDCARFGIQFVASPRFADVLLVTGPVGRAMHEPLVRCYESMAEPSLVVAAGTCAITGGLHRGGYAEANGVLPHLPVAAFIPGCPPHPLSIIDGICLAVGSPVAEVRT